MHQQHRFLRRNSLLVLMCYLSLVTEPLQAAMQQEVFARPKPGTDHSTPLSQLEQMRELTRQLVLQNSLNPAVKATGALGKAKALLQERQKAQREHDAADQLLALQTAFAQEAEVQDHELQATAKHIADKHLPEVIAQRQQAVLAQLQDRRQQVLANLQQLAKAHQQDNATARHQALDALTKQLEQWGGEQAQYTDVKHLPWGMPSDKVRAPLDSKQAYLYHVNDVLGVKPLQVAGPLPNDGPIWPVLPRLSAQALPEDTQANEDVQLTPAIQAKAAELNHNPAQIYKWVYDNIEFIPSYGSIQGADFTLQSKRGNAFDTASLLIALLRASGTPARYVYGTIEVPIGQVMNWVGGVTSPDAAQNLLGQGGIPNIALVSGGRTVALRMEQVWVEAFVDFVPSRGVVNRAPDTWVPLDASYKQYAYTAGMDLQQAVPFDAQGLVNAAQTGATVDPAGSYVQNLNQTGVQSSLNTYQQQLQTYFQQQQPNVTVGDVLGTKTIKPYRARGLSDTLQYPIVAVGGEYQTLPETMRNYFQVQVYQNDLERRSGVPAFDVKISTPTLAGKPLALSFKPSTAADEQTIASYMPQPHADGSPIQPSELPSTFPGYLIHLTPELTLGGQTLYSGGDFMLGQEVTTRLGYVGPNTSIPPLVTKIVRAGEYHAIGIDLQGTSQAQLTNFQSQLADSKLKIDSRAADKLALLTKHNMIGNILQAGILSYFAVNDVQDRAASSQAHIVVNRYMSFGTFSTNIQPNLTYGFPLSAKYTGMLMDIDQLFRTASALDNNHSQTRDFVNSQGARESANEHLIPELLLKQANKNQSVSATKAFQVAEQQGQKILTINQFNIDAIVPELQHPQFIIEEITNAIHAGKTVTISQASVSISNWTGTGYVVSDMTTGATAYLIEGGYNGGTINFTGYPFIDSLITPAYMSNYVDEEQYIGFAYDEVASKSYLMNFGVDLVKAEIKCHEDKMQSMANVIAVAIIAVIIISLVARSPILAGAFALAAFSGLFSQVAAASESDSVDVECICEKQNNFDRQQCDDIAGKLYDVTGIAICKASASTRYGECLSRGGPNKITTPLSGVETPL